jgi:hypothetical protein
MRHGLRILAHQFEPLTTQALGSPRRPQKGRGGNVIVSGVNRWGRGLGDMPVQGTGEGGEGVHLKVLSLHLTL